MKPSDLNKIKINDTNCTFLLKIELHSNYCHSAE